MTVQLSAQGAVIKTAYEGESDTNAFTDAEQAKLADISGTNTGDDPGLENVVEDTSPQLGGNLDLNGFNLDYEIVVPEDDTPLDLTIADLGKIFVAYNDNLSVNIPSEAVTPIPVGSSFFFVNVYAYEISFVPHVDIYLYGNGFYNYDETITSNVGMDRLKLTKFADDEWMLEGGDGALLGWVDSVSINTSGVIRDLEKWEMIHGTLKMVTATYPDDLTLTVPPATEVPHVPGNAVRVMQMGTSPVTIAAGVGVTLHAANGVVTAGQFHSLVLTCVATNEFVVETRSPANQAALDATTASFTTADETKLDGIEALADVTDATNVAAAGAHMSGGTDVPVADGGTGASTAGDALTNLGVTAYAQTLLDDANATTARATLGIAANIATFVVPASTTISTFGATLVDDADASAARTTLGSQEAISGASLTAVTVATDDKIVVQDTSDSNNIKSVTAQSIADLADNPLQYAPLIVGASLRSAQLVAAASWGNTAPANRLFVTFTEMIVGAGMTITEASIYVNVADASDSWRYAIYDDDGTDGAPDTLIHDFGEFSFASTGLVTKTSLSVALPPGRYWRALAATDGQTGTIRALAGGLTTLHGNGFTGSNGFLGAVADPTSAFTDSPTVSATQTSVGAYNVHMLFKGTELT